MLKSTVIDNYGSHHTDSGKPMTDLNFQQKSFRFFLAFLPFAVILLISTSYQRSTNEPHYAERENFSPAITDSLKGLLNEELPDTNTVFARENTLNREFLAEFYHRNSYKPVWIRHNGINEKASNLVYLIEHAREYGLEPCNYHIQTIRELYRHHEMKPAAGKDPTLDFNLEILLTDAALRLMINLHSGYVVFDSSLYASGWVTKLPDILLQGLSSGKIIESLLSVQPKFIEYAQLRKASEQYVRTNIISDYRAQIIYPNRDSSVLIQQIREALVSLGYLKAGNNTENIYNALKRFQQFHGLQPDGRPGLNTIEALVQSTLYNYRILALNLDRLRKKQYSDSTILYVNIPAYRLKIFSGNNLKDTFRIIVGNPLTPTPLLSGTMQRIIANPVWYVPKSIAMNEMLPKIKADSNYLEKNGFKILDQNYHLVSANALKVANTPEGDFNYTFRQDRGSDNSLGQVKFIFSNPYAVYLHDTPGKSLFSKDLRAFSHGCVRVEHPERLAHYILEEVNSDTTNFSRLMASGVQREFNIASPLPVHITYITCEADDKGQIVFYKDIYGMDKKELEQLSVLMGI